MTEEHIKNAAAMVALILTDMIRQPSFDNGDTSADDQLVKGLATMV